MSTPAPAPPILVLAPFAPVSPSGPLRLLEVDPGHFERALHDLAPRFWLPLPPDLGAGLSLQVSSLAGFLPERILEANPHLLPAPDPDDALEGLLAQVDLGDGGDRGRILGALASALARERAWTRCESAWRGLAAFLDRMEAPVRVLLCPVPDEGFEPLLEDLREALATDPPRCILADLEVDRTPAGLGRLEALAALGDALLCPVAAWAGPRILGLEAWSELPRLPYLRHLLDTDPAFAKWRAFRRRPLAQWASVACNAFRQGPARCSPVWLLGAAMLAPARPLRAALETPVSQGRVEDLAGIGLNLLAPGIPPAPVSVCGQPVGRTLTLAWIAGCLIRLREAPPDRADPRTLEAYVAEVLARGLREAGRDARGLEVRAEEGPEGLLLQIAFELPPGEGVPSEPVALTFNWR